MEYVWETWTRRVSFGGLVCSATGQPVSGAPVLLRQSNAKADKKSAGASSSVAIAFTRTRRNGYFCFTGLAAGAYALAVDLGRLDSGEYEALTARGTVVLPAGVKAGSAAPFVRLELAHRVTRDTSSATPPSREPDYLKVAPGFRIEEFH